MSIASPPLDIHRSRNIERGRIGLRTLILIRWITVAGQAATLLFVHLALGFNLPLKVALAVVAASIVVNILIMTQKPGTVRLGDRDATIYLGFDLIQLGALISLTGGLYNPFAFMLLAPVTVGANTLSRSRTIALSLVALGIATFLALWHLPLPWSDEQLQFPSLYVVAVWISLTVSIVFIAAFSWNVSEEGRRMNDALAATQLALAREQRVSAVVGLAAAAAHELGSPLGTIAVIAKELVRDLPAGSPFAEDAQLLLSETARCRTILAQLGERRDRDAVPHIDTVPVSALSDAVMQSITRAPGIEIAFRSLGGDDDQPMVTVTPELIHGLGNLIHNATTFARRQVTVTTAWDERWITMDIVDDGPGFSPQVLSRVGEPYLSSRSEDSDHMGLGIFIADTLLQRTGAVLTFANSPQGGAKVVVSWPRAMLDQEA